MKIYINHNKFNLKILKNIKKKWDIKKKQNIITYTISGRTDGFGAQYLSIMSAIAYCNYKKYKYIHTPFKSIEHNSKAKINLLNIFIGIPILDNINNDNIDITTYYSDDVHWSTTPSIYYNYNTINILKEYYYSSLKPNIKDIDIAIHIRRGDVSSNNQFNNRYDSNSYYNKIIKYLNEKYLNYNITIFSEGHVDDFNDIIGKNITFKLNTKIMKTFHSFVCAKILVTSKSTFSYSAAILNSNKIYYIDFWHKPLNNWIKLSDIIK